MVLINLSKRSKKRNMNEMSSSKTKIMNRNQIKYLVIVAMLIDHIAWAFVPTSSIPGQVMHFIGRLTGPTMAYFIAEGYAYTHNVKRYALRLGIFALISWAPFVLFEYGTLPVWFVDGEIRWEPSFGVIYTLFLSLLAIWLWDKGKCKRWLKILGIVGLCILSVFGDWPVFDVLFALFFFIYKDDTKKKWIAFSGIAFVEVGFIMLLGGMSQFFQIGVFMIPLLFLFCYNGESGSKRSIHKWFFYLFYPAHLLVLGLIRWIL